MGGIFISYRRNDSAGWTGRLSEHLVQHFGPDQIFMDIEKIEAGTDFVEAIESAVSSCSILLAIISPSWLAAVDAEGRRKIDKPDDFIRLEISTALKRNIRVIPVLVGGAVMPAASEIPDDLKPLARRQSHELSDSRWDYDTELLINTMEKAGIKRRQDDRPVGAASVRHPVKMSSKILIIIGVVLSITVILFSIRWLASHNASQELNRPERTSASSPLPTPSTQPAYSDPGTSPQTSPGTALSSVTGIWAGSDGLTYQIQQTGELVTLVGGYPNQAVIISGNGVINDRKIELDYYRVTDGSGGKAWFRVSDNSRTIQGRYRNMVSGEAGEMILTR